MAVIFAVAVTAFVCIELVLNIILFTDCCS